MRKSTQNALRAAPFLIVPLTFVDLTITHSTGKPTGMVAHFDKIPEALASALEGKQVQPVLL